MDSRPVPPVFLSSLPGSSARRGVWSAEEHDRFLQALKRFPDGPWQQLALCVGTRSTRQVQTHAQKFFEKIRRRQRGLRRSYVHTGMAREHRVDDDVVAILSSIANQADGNDDDSGDDDDDEKNDNDDVDDDEDDHDTKDRQQLDDDIEDSGGESKAGIVDSARTLTVTTSSKSPRAATPGSAGKRKRSRTQDQDHRTTANETPTPATTPKTLPKRIRIRRSARNALQIAASREQLYLQAMNHGLALADGDSGTVASTTASSSHLLGAIDPVEPTRVDHLPSIEEALDFFLNSIDAETIPSSQWFAEL